eukprot:8600747-Pyramimonas_sp.AAC.1
MKAVRFQKWDFRLGAKHVGPTTSQRLDVWRAVSFKMGRSPWRRAHSHTRAMEIERQQHGKIMATARQLHGSCMAKTWQWHGNGMAIA